jgi:dephospho-CoA kinase
MTEVGLTGNIGSGKTTVCRIFESLGVPVFYSDLEAKRLYLREDVQQKIQIEFGEKVFNNRGEVDFKKLATVIFSNKESLDFINNLIHPLVFENYRNWVKQNSRYPYLIHESAILFEHQLEKRFDKTIVVYSPQKLRVQRVMERDSVQESEVLKRISNQMKDEDKNRLADLLVTNDGIQMLIPQVMKIHDLLKG